MTQTDAPEAFQIREGARDRSTFHFRSMAYESSVSDFETVHPFKDFSAPLNNSF